MARPIPELEDISKLADEIKPKESKSIIDITVDTIRNKSTKYLVIGTITVRPRPPSEEPKPAVIQKPEPYKPDEPFEKPFLPSKPIPHPPKISPSSIPNPNPSVTANMETAYPNYTGFLYNIPGFSAFQPVNYSNNHSAPIPMQTESPKPDFKPFTITGSREVKESNDKFEREEEKVFGRREEKESIERIDIDTPKQQDFEDNFTMKIIPPTSKPDANKNLQMESKMSIASLVQGSGGSVIIPTNINKDIKKKTERYSLKTSIPISKIDMKCVSSPVDTAFQNAIKNPVFNPAFQKEVERPKVEIQSNIVIKTATNNKEAEAKDKHLVMTDRESLRHNKPFNPPACVAQSNSINTLINAAETINKNDNQFRVPEPKVEIPKEAKDPPVLTQPAAIQRPMFIPKDVPPVTSQPTGVIRPIFNPATTEVSKSISVQSPAVPRPMFNAVSVEASKLNSALTSAMPRAKFNPVSAESNKPNFPIKPPDGGYNEQKNLMFLQTQKQNPKMLLTIQPNPQVLLQRTNLESKNLQAPSRLSSQSKKSEVIADTSSKVVALKRLHQDNCDENDFENLITENQIYGNKIVVKEKSQATQEEWKNKVKVEKPTVQDWKNKLKIDIKVDKQPESKNVDLPNFVYVQFSSNLMKIKNNSKICQTTDSTKMKVSPNENRTTEINIVNNNNQDTNIIKDSRPHNVTINKEVNILKSNDNVLQTVSNNNNKTEVVFQTNQKVIVTPQVVYQVPIVVTEADHKNQAVKEPKIQLIQNKESPKQVETKPEKVIIKCKVDAKVPKIVIANLRPKVTTNTKVLKEVSSLDIYENKKRLRRLKYLSNTNKDVPKTDSNPTNKFVAKVGVNVITPDNMRAEIFKELSQTKGKTVEQSSDSESDFEEDELDEYNSIIETFGANYNENAKADFLAGLSLASREVFREKQLERHERTLKFDAIASAYIAAGRLDPLLEDQNAPTPEPQTQKTAPEADSKATLRKKHQFLAHFKLMRVSPSFRTDYEKSWREILRERNRRYGITNPEPFDPNGQLQMLTEINKSVNENNDLIKKRLDSVCDENSDIRILAEKNFSELNRLSKMADRSVKLFSGKDTKQRDLNPGFDSENIKKLKIDQKDYPRLNIPNISKIISLKTDQESGPMSSSQATSMDEPSNSASCGEVMTKEVACQADQRVPPWHGVTNVMDDFIQKYRKYEIGRKKEMDDLQRSNTQLRVECAHVTRSASRDSDRARALLAELQLLAGEEANLKTSLEKLNKAIDAVKKS